jgi:hypothetical protein
MKCTIYFTVFLELELNTFFWLFLLFAFPIGRAEFRTKSSASKPSDPSVSTVSVGEKSPPVQNHQVRLERPTVRVSELLAFCRPSLSFLSDLFFGEVLPHIPLGKSDPIGLAAYQSWTLLTALPVTLFYFSVWELALAGPEFSSLASLSPLFLGFSPVLSFATSHGGRTVLAGAAGAIGLGLWWAESMWVRLGAVMFGVFCTGIRWAAEWQADVESGYHAVGALFHPPSLIRYLDHFCLDLQCFC